jgi:hypothetical protein
VYCNTWGWPDSDRNVLCLKEQWRVVSGGNTRVYVMSFQVAYNWNNFLTSRGTVSLPRKSELCLVSCIPHQFSYSDTINRKVKIVVPSEIWNSGNNTILSEYPTFQVTDNLIVTCNSSWLSQKRCFQFDVVLIDCWSVLVYVLTRI